MQLIGSEWGTSGKFGMYNFRDVRARFAVKEEEIMGPTPGGCMIRKEN